jgi:hypothetical protein
VKLKRRRLPHLDVLGRPLFIAFRSHDSLPAQRPFPASNPTSVEAFVTMEGLLDRARCWPTFLGQPAMAQIFPTSIRYGAEVGRYESKLPGSIEAATENGAICMVQCRAGGLRGRRRPWACPTTVAA